MTVANTAVQSTYQGNGSNITFAIPFSFITNTQVKVRRTNTTTGVIDELLVGILWSIIGGNPGTHVEFFVAPASDELITVYRSTDKVQSIDYIDTGPFPAEAHERALDKIVMMVQEVQNAIDNIVVNIPTGSGAFTRLVDQSVVGGDTITIASNQRLYKFVQGSAGQQSADTTYPIDDGVVDGQELRLVGLSDTDTLTIFDSGNVSLNGDMVLAHNSILDLVWSADQTKWIETGRR